MVSVPVKKVFHRYTLFATRQNVHTNPKDAQEPSLQRPPWGKWLWLIAAVLLIPLIPFLIWEELLEEWIRRLLAQHWSTSSGLLAVLTILSLDIFLPVPSSAVITYGGAQFGLLTTTLAAAAGLTIGNVLGFGATRLFGPWMLERFTKRRDRDAIMRLNVRYSFWVLAITRPLPLLAEASVLLFGSLQLPWSVFFVAVVPCNLLIAFAYAAAGAWSLAYDVTVPVVVMSALLPVLFTYCVHHWWRPASTTD